jgi:lipopolysaccharide export system ATP-binding protein
MISGLVPVDRGRVGLLNEDVTFLPMYQRARRGLGYLPQESSIFRGLTVEENIRAALELTDLTRDRREKRLEQLLGEFSITKLRKTSALALSGGERRRVEIARALATNPAFVLLDEPFAGVDPIAVGDIRSLVWQLRDRGIGVLITDHNVRETLGIIDRAYIIHDGRVLMHGKPEEVVNDENVRRVYLGEGFRI